MPTPHPTHRPPPDWRMPEGVNRGLWDYLHSEEIAAGYDASLRDSALLRHDLDFVAGHCPDPCRLLDLGCGTGRLLLHMAARGHRVLGVDLSLPMLRVAAEKAGAANLAVHLVQANIARLDCLADASFERAACLFSTLGMVVGAASRRAVVGHVHRLLRPGGSFLLHVHNRWHNLRTGPGRRWLLRDLVSGWRDGPERGDMVMPTHQGVAGLTLHLFTRREAVALLRDAGFRVREVRPVSLRPDGRLCCPWLLGSLRAYGFLLVAERPA